jgi:purine-binding chemotaxis protein CheW
MSASDEINLDQYLTFFVKEHECAVPILRTREIIELGSVTRVPGAPPSIRGVLNLRGTIVPVIDLATRFGQGESAITKWTCVVVVEMDLDGDKVLMGLLADAVSQVLGFAASEIEPPPAFGVPVRADCLKALGKLDSRFVLILDLDRMLAPGEMQALTATEKAS